jgi:hypothetical protein
LGRQYMSRLAAGAADPGPDPMLSSPIGGGSLAGLSYS